MPLALIAVRPLLAATYDDGTGGGLFAFVRLATSVAAGQHSRRVHGRDLPDRVTVDGARLIHSGA